MVQVLVLGLNLAAFWLLMSGHYTGLLLSFGALSILGVLLLARRMDRVDQTADSGTLKLSALFYVPWLLWEVIKSNIDVARIILSPRPNVSPTVFAVEATQKTDVGRVLYANSITLTPGTVTIDMDGNTFTVHALTRAGAEALLTGEMDRRVTQVEAAV